MIIKFCSNGIILKCEQERILNNKIKSDISKRGKIQKFSFKSASRLRDYLLNLDTTKGEILSITLTLPTCNDEKYWAAALSRFRHRLAYYGIGMIWRVELQKRKIPHLHCVSVIDSIDKIGYIWKSWLQSQSEEIQYNEYFAIYGCAIQFCSLGWFRYVAAHAVKHKQSQLGWQGRQWGIFNKEFLNFSSPVEYNLTYRQELYLRRLCRRKFRIKDIVRISFFKQTSTFDRILKYFS